ncbi:hypothetical protein [Actinopolymorpha pittospori]|uniref:Uncharacterized protein n=1 Tax=Actinopolymorpha pittospori TaxID=648752 RepID=A0A927N7W6_9ACTN|nr:hypothetical protein [Actinopolymorpha pittospori]MBE1611848.1 hypothetical protein [Actinopolymorpha pittospori]
MGVPGCQYGGLPEGRPGAPLGRCLPGSGVVLEERFTRARLLAEINPVGRVDHSPAHTGLVMP